MDIFFGIIVGLCFAIVLLYVGWKIGLEEGYDEGLSRGYEEGMKDSIQEEAVIDVPKTGDGKFYSTRAAMRSISEVGDE